MIYSIEDIVKKNLKFAKKEEINFLVQMIGDLSLIRQIIFLERYKEIRNRNFVYLVFFIGLCLIGFMFMIASEVPYILWIAVFLAVLNLGIFLLIIKNLNYKKYVRKAEKIHKKLKIKGPILTRNFKMPVNKKDSPLKFVAKNVKVSVVLDDNGISITQETGEKEIIDYRDIKWTGTSKDNDYAILKLKNGRRIEFMTYDPGIQEFIYSVYAVTKNLKYF